MERSKQSNEILDIVKASECFSMGGYGLIELALRELDKKVAEYEENKYYVELGKAVEQAFNKGAILVYDTVYGSDGEIISYTYDEELVELLEWTESEG